MTAKWHTEDELRTLLRGPENEFTERKRGFDKAGSASVLQTVCAFANDFPERKKPGVIFIGADDKSGKPVNRAVDEKLLAQLGGVREDPKFSAPLAVLATRVSCEDGEVAALQVAPSSSPPVKFLQRVYVRTDASTRAATFEEELRLSEMRLRRNRPFDLSPLPHAGLDDLNLSFFREDYLPKIVDEDTLKANRRELTAQLAAAKMIDRDEGDRSVPTVLGMLVLGRCPKDFLPGAYVQFLRIDSNEWDDPVDEEAIFGTIPDIARRLREKLRAHNRVRVEYVSVPLEKRHWLYPETALLQITHNAIMHRRYEGTNAPVRVYWFNNRIEIDNPGGLHGDVRARASEFPDAGCDYRNPNLAEAMKALGLVQTFGSGLGLARQDLEKNGNPPIEWKRDILEVHVHCILRPADMGGKFRMSQKTMISLAQLLRLLNTRDNELFRKHGVADPMGGRDIEEMLARAEAKQLRGLLNEINRKKNTLRLQMSDGMTENEKREKDAIFSEHWEDLRLCLREDGFRFREDGENGGDGLISV